MINLQELAQRRQQLAQAAAQRLLQAQQVWNGIPALIQQGLNSAPRDWVSLECLANEPAYAKTDTRKRFVLWEARKIGGITIEKGVGIAQQHAAVISLFIPPNLNVVRFPFNPGDSSPRDSLSWDSIDPNLRSQNPRFFEMTRFSTASRSNLALVPLNPQNLQALPRFPGADARLETAVNNHNRAVHPAEWTSLNQWLNRAQGAPPRFVGLVRDPGHAASPQGIQVNGAPYRLYSIKTGVNYVGSTYEGPGAGNKHALESNSSMAMLRSNVVRGLPNRDTTFGVQTEILTITAPLRDGRRDGFQVRELSCMVPRFQYLPGQAIPYARQHFDRAASEADRCAFWRNAFAVPLGRAKARIFLNYGLVHTSANAQNFVLGFAGHGVRQFVARDLGDTSWHDDYIRDYVRFTNDKGLTVYRALCDEQGANVRHVLRNTSSGQYPAPHMVRLAAYSVLTHRFGASLGWSRANLHLFITGVFDGFLSYIQECLGLELRYPTNPGQPLHDQEIDDIGTDGAYPHMNEQRYLQQVEDCLRLLPEALLRQAAWVRRRSAQRLLQGGDDGVLQRAVHAEEMLLCASVEKFLRTADKAPLRRRLQPLFTQGNWPAVVQW